ncbi:MULTISPECIES: DUF3551 domain-containing protein [Bradyrhizobium]|jgi:hypothetical protein|uniref:DUF3551 domain-containing protein n=1 Tax=Bradyrhizobium denitrificans TaxID=2734912 RepID=A0ABS5GHJ7_9BRAD|nr:MULTISPECIES: DUF3551 domain-containing protein [Bradyrhizobium]RTL91216.1 MAG: DUF3551 domain-containing protein [Bradyrhizobiaceae bacterium]MBR1140723.1 DUF3551 domain-containing protein [Bradyrhizobium denitrificans]MCL8488031.1 DUF3551 domain-containing protein [Bradyrhizobium denitrificans]MDH6264133.1 hypothetical protein [Bradyrhizobium sp. BR13661]MDU0959433.1 DUF3551 domain-containing protein [Bradyrhizobium sp.]
MNKVFASGMIVAAALAAAALVMPTQPAAAKEYEFCRQDWGSGMRNCAFDTMEQCVAMISGRGGTCVRNPVGNEPTASYAYASKAHMRSHH